MSAAAGAAHFDWRVERIAPGESAAAWQGALAGFDEASARVLKRDGADVVLAATVSGREVVVKGWLLGTLWARVKHRARGSRAWRQWRGAELLRGAGIGTPACYAVVTERGAAGVRAWLVMERVEGRSVLEHLAAGDLSARQEHAVARAIGGMLRGLVRAGVHNRDGKPSNVIVTGFDAAGEARVAVIDTVGVRRRRADVVEMMKNLCMEAMGHGCMARRGLRMRVVREVVGAPSGRLRRPPPPEGEEREMWRAVGERIEGHGDPMPRVDMLSDARESGGREDSRR
ncbi:MAG: lipopolysaccharide kinase InaA family protein [Phycisphaerales bacterium]